MDSEKKISRISSIDVFRGFTISAMTFVNTTGNFITTPAWLQHATGVGLTITDLVAPFFIFAIALTFKISFEKGENESRLHKYTRTLRRYLAFTAMGLLGSLTFIDDIPRIGWGVLAFIGMAGCITVFFIELSWKIRLLIALFLMITYQIISELYIGEILLLQSDGGLFGAISWITMLLLGTILAEFLRSTKKENFIYAGITLSGIGTLLHFILHLNGLIGCTKRQVSVSYVLISVGVSSIVYYVFIYLYDIKKMKIGKDTFEAQGKNPLLLYIIHGIFVSFLIPALFADSLEFYLVLPIALINMGIIALIGRKLDKNKVFIRF